MHQHFICVDKCDASEINPKIEEAPSEVHTTVSHNRIDAEPHGQDTHKNRGSSRDYFRLNFLGVKYRCNYDSKCQTDPKQRKKIKCSIDLTDFVRKKRYFCGTPIYVHPINRKVSLENIPDARQLIEWIGENKIDFSFRPAQ